MKQKHILIAALVTITFAAFAQQAKVSKPKTVPLPTNLFNNLHDSCTSLDIVFLTGKGGSMSLDGRNVKFFTSFMTPGPVDKKKAATAQDATIMWEKEGREYLSGTIYFTGDSSGYITFTKNNKEYANGLTPQGAGFLQTHGK